MLAIKLKSRFRTFAVVARFKAISVKEVALVNIDVFFKLINGMKLKA